MSASNKLFWNILIGVLCSLSISIKWTGLATPALIAVESFFGLFFLKSRAVPFSHLLIILFVAFVLYFTWFMVHFAMLPNTGPGNGFMTAGFQKTLIGSDTYDPNAPFYPLRFFYELNKEMLLANARISKRHAWESLWWEWPLNLRGLLYFTKKFEIGSVATKSRIYLLGNPVVLWLVIVGLVFSVILTVGYVRYRASSVFLVRIY